MLPVSNVHLGNSSG